MIDLKKIRQKKNMSQSEFARALGTLVQEINSYEKGRRLMSLDKKIKYLKKLGYTVTISISQKTDK